MENLTNSYEILIEIDRKGTRVFEKKVSIHQKKKPERYQRSKPGFDQIVTGHYLISNVGDSQNAIFSHLITAPSDE